MQLSKNPGSGRRVVAGLTAAVAAGCLLAGCGGAPAEPNGPSEPTQLDITRKQYSRPAALARDSSAIVSGRLDAVRERTVDDGGGAGPAIPTVLYRFRVADQAPGSDAPPDITLAWVDQERVELPGAITVHPGDRYLLFLNRVPEAERGGLPGRGTIYTPVGMNAGIFRLDGGAAHPTDPALGSPQPEARSARQAGLDPADLLELRPGQS